MISYVFKRVEMKYLLTEEQYASVLGTLSDRLTPDAYGETTVQSLYYDTENDRIIRSSVEQPIYKEKLRLRCYGMNDDDRDVYLEMKRKYDGIVYKRRISLKEKEAAEILSGTVPASQIGREIRYFISFYPDLAPKVMILYDRSAWFDRESDLRVTFDRNVRFRTDALNFHTSLAGRNILPSDRVLMECKTGTALPIWLTHLFCREGIFKTPFSKYGSAYRILRSEKTVLPYLTRSI